MATNVGGIAQGVQEIDAESSRLENAMKRIADDGWVIVDNKLLFKDFYFELTVSQDVFANTVQQPLSLFGLFDTYLPQNLLQRVLDDIPPDNWALGTSSTRRVGTKLKYVYKVLAAQIYIIGHQGVDVEGDVNTLDIRYSMNAAKEFFQAQCDEGLGIKFPNESIWKKYNSTFHLHANYYSLISQKFRSILSSFGECVAGDEKLFHFTGDTPYLRYVPTKPDRVGLWMYELCVKLPNLKPYLIHCRMESASARLGTHSTVTDIVEEWIDIIAELDDPYTILFIDSYYHSRGVRNLMVERGVSYCAASTENSFNDLCTVLTRKVTKRGKYAMAWKASTNELFVHFYSEEERIGRKFVCSTAYLRQVGRLPQGPARHIPGFDLFRLGFNFCDSFNRNLPKTTFPHKSGGYQHHGERGHQHKYMMAVILQNIFAMYDHMHPQQPLPDNNTTRCEQLAKALYTRALHL